MPRYAVFIRDAESVEEFVALARIDTEAEGEYRAEKRALLLHVENTQRRFVPDDVALCARLPEVVAMPTGTSAIRMF